MQVSVFISKRSAHEAGRTAIKGRPLRYRVERRMNRNPDRSAEIGYRVSLWSCEGRVGWLCE
jgi:hypothetical protein